MGSKCSVSVYSYGLDIHLLRVKYIAADKKLFADENVQMEAFILLLSFPLGKDPVLIIRFIFGKIIRWIFQVLWRNKYISIPICYKLCPAWPNFPCWMTTKIFINASEAVQWTWVDIIYSRLRVLLVGPGKPSLGKTNHSILHTWRPQ